VVPDAGFDRDEMTVTHLGFLYRNPLRRQPFEVGIGMDLFATLGQDHRNVTKFVEQVADGYAQEHIVLTASRSSYAFQTRSPHGLGSQLATYLRLGMEHLLTGYDHVLFLLALIVTAGRLIELVKIVTAFTAGHSLTLIAAALGWVSLPGRLVESVIAFTIVFVALENFARLQVAGRWLVTLVFGLMHGFGFANALAGLGLPRHDLVPSLLAFNVGVELGQLAIVAALFPLILLLRRLSFHREVVLAVSAGIALFGTAWLLERSLDLRWPRTAPPPRAGVAAAPLGRAMAGSSGPVSPARLAGSAGPAGLAAPPGTAALPPLPDGAEVMQRVNARPRGAASRLRLEMTLRDEARDVSFHKSVLAERKRFPSGYRTTYRVTSAGTEEGLGLLIAEDAAARGMWIYFPISRQLVPVATRGLAALASDFSCEDLLEQVPLGDFSFRTLGRGGTGSEAALLVEMLPRGERLAGELGFWRAVGWVRQDSWMIVRAEYYDAAGQPLKSFVAADVEQVSGIWTVRRFAMANHRARHRTEVQVTAVDYRVVLPDGLFAPERLPPPQHRTDARLEGSPAAPAGLSK
jgi:hypothetical protein